MGSLGDVERTTTEIQCLTVRRNEPEEMLSLAESNRGIGTKPSKHYQIGTCHQ